MLYAPRSVAQPEVAMPTTVWCHPVVSCLTSRTTNMRYPLAYLCENNVLTFPFRVLMHQRAVYASLRRYVARLVMKMKVGERLGTSDDFDTDFRQFQVFKSVL